MKTRALFFLFGLLAAGCAAPRASFDRVQSTVAERTGQQVHWRRGEPGDTQVEQSVQALLRQKLTAESAVQRKIERGPLL